MNDVGRHQLRINLKKLRYISEFFMDASDKKAVKAYIKQISLLQELLGAHNDLVCAEMTLRQIATSLSRQSQITVGKILGWYGHASLDKEFRLLRKWRKFSHSNAVLVYRRASDGSG
jgi:CHAD domain-containing protein